MPYRELAERPEYPADGPAPLAPYPRRKMSRIEKWCLASCFAWIFCALTDIGQYLLHTNTIFTPMLLGMRVVCFTSSYFSYRKLKGREINKYLVEMARHNDERERQKQQEKIDGVNRALDEIGTRVPNKSWTPRYLP